MEIAFVVTVADNNNMWYIKKIEYLYFANCSFRYKKAGDSVGKIIYMEDYKLVDRYLSGEKEAGKELYEKAYAPLLQFIRRQCKGCGFSAADFEDIASETMLRSVEKLDSFNGKSQFITFLCGFAKHVIQEYARKKKREIPTDPDDTLLDAEDILFADLSKYGIHPESYVIRKEDRESIVWAFEKLKAENPAYYDIIKLRVFNEVPFLQIAAFSGESVSALESRYRRALMALSRILL